MSKVYFLGAGATKAVADKAPLNSDLLKAAFYQSRDEEAYKGVNKEISETKDFIRKVFHKNEPNNLPRLEDILSFIDYNIRSKAVTIKFYSYEDLIKIRNNIVKIICAVLQNNLKKLDSDATNTFVKKITKEDVIISTNYDIVIDDALFSELKSINYGVRIRKSILPISMADGTTIAGHDTSFNINKGEIKLLKIHGSLNWLYCPKCDEVDLTVEQKGIAKYLGDDYRLYCSNNNCTCAYEPLIVTPTKFKIYENRILKEIWNISKNCISKADEIVFIGYSLPEADVEIRCLLLNGLNEGEEKGKIIFVDRQKGSDHINRYENLFGKVEYLPIGFTEYIKRMM